MDRAPVTITRDPDTGAITITPRDGYVITDEQADPDEGTGLPHIQYGHTWPDGTNWNITATAKPRAKIAQAAREAQDTADRLTRLLDNTPEDTA